MKAVKIHNQLKSIRESQGFTQSQIAKQVKISERHYQSIEAGETKPNVYLAIQLAKALNTTVEQLFAVADDYNLSTK